MAVYLPIILPIILNTVDVFELLETFFINNFSICSVLLSARTYVTWSISKSPESFSCPLCNSPTTVKIYKNIHLGATYE